MLLIRIRLSWSCHIFLNYIFSFYKWAVNLEFLAINFILFTSAEPLTSASKIYIAPYPLKRSQLAAIEHPQKAPRPNST
jgi:hypothetical protein